MRISSRHQRYVTVDFVTDALGYPRPVRATQQPTEAEARMHVAKAILLDAGCVAFSRSVDEVRGLYDEGDLLALSGEVDLGALVQA